LHVLHIANSATGLPFKTIPYHYEMSTNLSHMAMDALEIKNKLREEKQQLAKET